MLTEHGRGNETRRYTPEEEDFLRRNPGDEARMAQALGGSTSHRPYDSQTTDQGQQAANTRADEAQSGRDSALQRVSQTYSSGSGTGDVLSYLREQQGRQDQERASMREILMGQLTGLQDPVSVDTPGIREQIQAQRIESQRGAEQQRRVLAERMTAQGIGDSGAFDTGVMGIAQDRAESNVRGVADVLGRETQQRREQLTQLLQLAVASGDSEAARTIQAQLQALGMQQQSEQFNQGLGFNYDQLGSQNAFASAGLNQQALLALLGAI